MPPLSYSIINYNDLSKSNILYNSLKLILQMQLNPLTQLNSPLFFPLWTCSISFLGENPKTPIEEPGPWILIWGHIFIRGKPQIKTATVGGDPQWQKTPLLTH